jgi:hypothetical protein
MNPVTLPHFATTPSNTRRDLVITSWLGLSEQIFPIDKWDKRKRVSGLHDHAHQLRQHRQFK